MITRVLLLSVFSIFITAWNCFAQVDSVAVKKVSILNTKHKVEGIYKTFEEFRRNQPFYTDSFKVLPFDLDDKVLINARNDELVYRNQEGRLKQQGAQRFFGYCRKDSIYISTSLTMTYHGPTMFEIVSFCPIIEFGHLSITQFKKYIGNPNVVNMRIVPGAQKYGTPFSVSPKDKPLEELYMLDFMNGDYYPVKTAALLTKLQLWDKELYEEFRKMKRKERKKLEVRLAFIRRFNQRHPIKF